mgnify:CR=1 FL=1
MFSNYLGMTVHWLDKNLRRKKAILCCREIKTSLTHDVIATVVGDVLSEYNILDKTVCVTTDNGSNFIKAFEYVFCYFTTLSKNGKIFYFYISVQVDWNKMNK